MPFDAYAAYYDLLYRDKDYRGEANYVASLLARWRPRSETLLEFGCGSGIHAAFFAELGFSVHGIEISEGMIEKAGRLRASHPNGSRLAFSRGDVRNVRLGKTFDAVLSLFHVVSYQTTNKDVQALFATSREHLTAGGIFLFDVWFGPAVLTDRPAVRIKRMENEALAVTRIAEPAMHPNRNVVDVNYTVLVRDKANNETREIHETHPMRYFFPPEIELLAQQSGLEVLHSEEWMSGHRPGFDTWGVVFVLRAVCSKDL